MRWTQVLVISGVFVALGTVALGAPFGVEYVRSVMMRPAPPGPIHHLPMGFRHMGYGELSTCASDRYPIIERLGQGGIATFLVKASVPCGLEVRNPMNRLQDGVLHLSYETHFTGSVDMCNCEYRSVFALDGVSSTVTRVEFSEVFVDETAH